MKNGWRIPWNVTAVSETFKISCLMGRHLVRGGSQYHLKAPVIPFGAMVEYHPSSSKDLSRLHQFVAKVLPDIFLGYALYAEWKLHTPCSRWNSKNLWERTASENIHFNPGAS